MTQNARVTEDAIVSPRMKLDEKCDICSTYLLPLLTPARLERRHAVVPHQPVGEILPGDDARKHVERKMSTYLLDK